MSDVHLTIWEYTDSETWQHWNALTMKNTDSEVFTIKHQLCTSLFKWNLETSKNESMVSIIYSITVSILK